MKTPLFRDVCNTPLSMKPWGKDMQRWWCLVNAKKRPSSNGKLDVSRFWHDTVWFKPIIISIVALTYCKYILARNYGDLFFVSPHFPWVIYVGLSKSGYYTQEWSSLGKVKINHDVQGHFPRNALHKRLNHSLQCVPYA